LTELPAKRTAEWYAVAVDREGRACAALNGLARR